MALGLVYGAIVGIVVLILYYDRSGTPADRFMTGLGIPALLAGAIATSTHTGEVQKLQETTQQLSAAAANASQIHIENTPSSIQPVSQAPGNGLSFEMLLGIGSAYAGDGRTVVAQSAWNTAIQVNQPSYAILVETSPSADAAQKRAAQLRTKWPSAQAVKIEKGYGVITGVEPESKAVLEAIRIKKESGVAPELLRTK